MVAAFPQRPVRYVVPFRPDGPPDVVGRLVAGALETLWQQPVMVDNRPGVNGSVGSEFVVHSPPDGHTLLQGTSATHGTNAVLLPLLAFDPFRDLAPVVPLIEGPLFLAAGATQPFRSLPELIAHAQRHPGQVRYATAGPGSPQHLAGELLRTRAGIDIVPVHHAGAAEALRALVQDEVEIYFGSDFSAHPDAARLPLLAVSTRWRWPSSPHVPTLVELGVPDFEIHGWFGVFVPAATPADTIEKINADINHVLALPATVAGIARFGYRVLGGTAADFARRLERERAYWRDLVRRNGLTLV